MPATSAGRLPYYSLAGGFLTGKYRSKADLGKSAARGGSVAKYLDGKGPAVLSALDEVAGAAAATSTQVALAWVMARPGITAHRQRLEARAGRRSCQGHDAEVVDRTDRGAGACKRARWVMIIDGVTSCTRCSS